ncbi:MOSC N-terminal beta barrel domain-containing protein [Pasteurella skyensis]|uniref:MOSC N-terminal beta barrel domain-containing protein n=1 Tax=Phocoenobacter skyensis TaxID=97481 RepID=A0AAJ6N831_9PAST|nr:MOSC N-terminal beta barrel domain-containing protein [Pasteurella skyensis]MDP8161783.1 MOSC N-terminal beta barrel domain-containing protein [Pasteurella skyensis]MDP8171939.1 MOSC N-terminal beta barrel domain-containing protein [Pasteurella skyensis]MDP8176174.1 MOSC N-terminal beta barrel domain-containing protein [Pasteurella skyensis]MDP8178194.1 MOSC N-terminal beta barrel domain-containing protein [Pasteurella skyensis]MDP8182198.1 MOSC N-terminal beta barrel domain-containing prot
MVITQLWIYPIKSCKGIAVSSIDLLESGLRYDREMMIVDDETGKFVTQRSDKILAHIEVSLPDEESVQLTFNKRSIIFKKQYIQTQAVDTTVWRRDVPAFDQGDEVACFLSQIIGRNVRLLATRPVDTLNAQKNILFQDGQAVHLLTESSLNHAQQALSDYQIDTQRFRPNIVIGKSEPNEILEAFSEDNWKKVSTEQIDLTITKLCERCAIPSINPQTLDKERAVDHYLKQYRMIDKKPMFGVCGYSSKLGTLNIGDTIIVTA